VGHDDVVDVVFDDLFDAVVDGAVQAEALTPDDLGSQMLCPLRHLVVVTGHEGRELASGPDHPGGHPAGEALAIFVVEGAHETALGGTEPLHRDENGHLHWTRL
jgi:hypothetical protein